MEPSINFELTLSEANIILRVLGKHPFDEVAALIQKIKAQGDSQLAEIEAQGAQRQSDEPPTES